MTFTFTLILALLGAGLLFAGVRGWPAWRSLRAARRAVQTTVAGARHGDLVRITGRVTLAEPDGPPRACTRWHVGSSQEGDDHDEARWSWGIRWARVPAPTYLLEDSSGVARVEIDAGLVLLGAFDDRGPRIDAGDLVTVVGLAHRDAAPGDSPYRGGPPPLTLRERAGTVILVHKHKEVTTA